MIAYCRRFINNCDQKKAKLKGALTVGEVEAASLSIVKVVQCASFAGKINQLANKKPVDSGKLLPLNPSPF